MNEHMQADSHESISVKTVPTPNPDALMFRVDEVLVPTGTYEYRGAEEAAQSPLALELLAIEGTELVLIAPRFITLRKEPDADWPDIVPHVKDRMRRFMASGEMAVFETTSAERRQPGSEVETRIIELIDEQIRPAIAQDGGDVTYLGFVDGIVQLKLIGACGTCPSAVTTLKMGIERLLMEEIPEVQGVEQEGLTT